MPEVFVAAGSNIRPREHLRKALGLMREAWPALRVSRAYANRAVGFEGDDFVNLVLARLHAIESACGRARDAAKWAPRSMDLDVLLYGDVVGEFPGAVLPRKDLLRRPYMLGPMAEVGPEVVHPTERRRIGELWAEFDSAGHVMTPVSLDEGD